MINLRKTVAAGLAASILGVGFAATSTPAAARGLAGRVETHPGVPLRTLEGNRHHFHRHFGWGLGGIAGGLALGAAYYDGYSECYFARQPVIGTYDNIIGYRRVPICN